ncbi:MAG: OmpH family outer membrane protein [Bacteroidales bacterium]|nr:OmpH family outer membrane protein [Bacteroidales bacterium]
MNTMKLFVTAILFLSFTGLQAQKIAYVESQKILEQMPEYKKAKEEIDRQKDTWQKEMQTKFNQVEVLYQNYVDYEATYSDQVRKQKQEEIFDAEKKAKEFKEEKFGYEGELFRLQESKLKPFQTKIYEAAKKVADENGYDFVFDKGPETPWIYMSPEHDITFMVNEKLSLE